VADETLEPGSLIETQQAERGPEAPAVGEYPEDNPA
jgi:hypothetical protein